MLNNYAACRNSEIFEDPEHFIPERWDRSESHRIHAFASLPFGYGTRSCVGESDYNSLGTISKVQRHQQQEIHNPLPPLNMKKENWLFIESV